MRQSNVPGTNQLSSNLADLLHISEDKLTVLSFSADWLGTSHIMEVYINDLTKTYRGKVEFVTINQSSSGDALFSHFNVQELPTLIFLHQREIIKQISGIVARRIIQQHIEEMLNDR